jgi:ligand-binding sensor domain-containing protein/signal transduction histidine kinase/DNA-binding response OmpR family regulator
VQKKIKDVYLTAFHTKYFSIKMKVCTIASSGLLALILCTTSIRAEGLNFRKVDMTSGMSFNSVLCLMEDTDGLLWIGTREGLNRYDGHHFHIYRYSPYNAASLSNNHINVIFQSSRHDIWIGTSNGLNRFVPETDSFEFFPAAPDSSGLSNNYVKSITESHDGKIWIGTSNGINILDPVTKKFRHIYPNPASNSANNIISLFRDKSNRLWIGTQEALYLRQDDEFVPINLTGAKLEIRDIKQDAGGDLWLATERNGIIRFSYTHPLPTLKGHWHRGNSAILSNQVRRLLIDETRVWLATLSGLSIFDPLSGTFTNTQYSIEKTNGLSRGSLHDILKDRFGGYWIATYSGGLNYYHRQHNLFRHYRRIAGVTTGLSENDVNGFIEDPRGNLWISTGRGLNRANLSTGQFRYYEENTAEGLSNRIIKCMTADKDGNLWIGTYDGLNFFDVRNERFHHFYHQPGHNSINANQIHALYIDPDGLLWIGMNMGEFQVYDPRTALFENIYGVGNIVNCIYEDSHSRLWLASRTGLKCIDRKTRQIIDITPLVRGFEDDLLYVNSIMEDTHSRLWIGTQSSGLFLLRDQRLFWFGQGNGINSNTINAILEDPQGHLWISTNAGLSRVEYHQDTEGNPTLTSTNFSELHGLQGPQYNPGSAYRNPKGQMFFGGINGFNVFNPQEIRKEILYPKVIVNEIRIHTNNNTSDIVKRGVLNDSLITLKYQQRNITVSFVGLNYVNPSETEYRYRLADKDNGWIHNGASRALNFSYLPVGTHRLHIQAGTHPHHWPQSSTAVTLHVLPPWWQSTPAGLTYLILFGALLYLFFFYSQRWAALKSRLSMEKIIHEKEQEMYESKLDFFTDISHELRTPLTLILAPVEEIMKHPGLPGKLYSNLLLMEKNGRKMMEMINQVLNLRRFETNQFRAFNPSGSDLIHFVKEISLAFKPLADSRNIRFILHLPGGTINMHFDSNKLEIVIFNLLSNAFKFTPENGEVTMTLQQIPAAQLPPTHRPLAPQSILIKVRDSGTGITPAAAANVFQRFHSDNSAYNLNPYGTGIGLELTKRMVELHGGHITIQTAAPPAPVTYTQFSVYLPHNHQSAPAPVPPLEVSPPEDEVFVHDLHSVQLPDIEKGEKQTLLLVEDNHDVRHLIKSIFTRHYEVSEATEGNTAWQLATQHLPDLIISDIMMPGMNGIDLCRKLKKDVRTSHIPVILLTARATVAFKYQGFETGADAYITKPFSPAYLLLRVKNLIKQRENIKNWLQREAILEPEKHIINSVDDKFLKKTMEYIETHIANSRLSIEQISIEVGLSRMHFHRKIKSLTGATPAEFVRNIRLKKAAGILQQNTTSIKEAMVMTGFEDADYFRKCFKELFGQTPSDYQRHQNTE